MKAKTHCSALKKRRRKNHHLLEALSQLDANKVLAPDSPKVEGPDPSLLHHSLGGEDGGGGPEELGLVRKGKTYMKQ